MSMEDPRRYTHGQQTSRKLRRFCLYRKWVACMCCVALAVQRQSSLTNWRCTTGGAQSKSVEGLAIAHRGVWTQHAVAHFRWTHGHPDHDHDDQCRYQCYPLVHQYPSPEVPAERRCEGGPSSHSTGWCPNHRSNPDSDIAIAVACRAIHCDVIPTRKGLTKVPVFFLFLCLMGLGLWTPNVGFLRLLAIVTLGGRVLALHWPRCKVFMPVPRISRN